MVPVWVMLPLPSCIHVIGSFVHCVMFWLVVLVMCPVSHWLVLVTWPVLFAISSHLVPLFPVVYWCCNCCCESSLCYAKSGLFVPSQVCSSQVCSSQVSVWIMFGFWITFVNKLHMGSSLRLPPGDWSLQLRWRRGDELLNKVVIFVFFAYKKYSRSFVKLRLNPWCHMDYFTDLLATFLDLDLVRTLAVYGGSEISWIPSKIS